MSDARAATTAAPHSNAPSSGERILSMWRRTRGLPLGDALFSFLLGRAVPYSGTIGARVIELEPGRATVELRDRRAVRNHLRSIHAIALANLGELTSGLAMSAALPPGVQAIITGIDIQYMKKARGRIVATSRVDLPPVEGDVEHLVVSDLRDEASDTVARLTARWRLRPL